MPGQGKKGKVVEGDGGEAEPPPPDNRSWIQVSFLHWHRAEPLSLCGLLSIYSEGTKIKCRAATQLLGATDWLHVTPEDFAFVQKNWIFLIPAALMVTVHLLSFAVSMPFLKTHCLDSSRLCAVLYAYHRTPMRCWWAEPTLFVLC